MSSIATAVLIVLLAGSTVAAQTVQYVDDDAAAGGNGLTWGSAHDTLPPALTAAPPFIQFPQDLILTHSQMPSDH